jgi:hypothetical protein
MRAHNEMAIFDAQLHLHKQSLIDRMLDWVQWWENLSEPPRAGFLARVTSSAIFEFLVFSAILGNTVFVAYEADLSMRNLDTNGPEYISHVNLGFLGFFTVELILRLLVHRLYFFANDDMRWNVLDFVLVVLSILDFILTFVVIKGGRGDNNVVFMRILRLLKLSRIFRTLRAVKVFKDLHVMMDSFASSFLALFWTFVTLFFILYVFALVHLQGLEDFVRKERGHLNTEIVEKVEKYLARCQDPCCHCFKQ